MIQLKQKEDIEISKLLITLTQHEFIEEMNKRNKKREQEE